MGHRRWKYLVVSFLLFSLLTIIPVVNAQSKFVLRGEQHWDTYGVGGTCDHGPNDLAIADVDGDGFNEIIVGGFTYNMINGSRTPLEAPLTVWTWNGENFTLKQSIKWSGTIEVVYAADVNGDGRKEVLTAGLFTNDSGTYGSLRVWHWTNGGLSLEAHYEGVSVSSIFVTDLNKNGTADILGTGTLNSDPQNTARLFLWRLVGNNLILEDDWSLSAANVTSSSSVCASDLANNGQIEVLTAGYSGNLNDSKGQLCVWSVNGTTLSLEASKEWQTVSAGYAPNIAGGVLGNTVVNNMKVADLNGDGIPEIVTGGFTYDGSKAEGQLRVWDWNGVDLILKGSQEWKDDDITLVYCVTFGDVDGSGHTEIVTGGMLAPYGSFNTNATRPDRGQICVWSYNGKSLALKESQDWVFALGVSVWNVGVADLRNDGKVEIISSGCISMNDLCDPDMRVWTLAPATEEALATPLVSASIIILAIAVCAAAFLLVRRSRLKIKQDT
jgi:hypothetical protein